MSELKNVSMTNTEKFLAKRPYYNPQHVADMAVNMAADGIPFCDICCDWHENGKECSA